MTPTTTIYKQWFVERIKPSLSLVVCLLLGVLTSVLSVYFSLDAAGYKLTVFAAILPLSWQALLANFSFFNEFLFKLMAYILGNNMGFEASMMLMTILFLTLKLQYLGRITHHFYLAVFFYSCFYLFLLEGTVARVGFATAFVMMAFYYLKMEQFWKSLFLILISSQIHLTSILFLMAFPLYFFPKTFWIVLSLCLLAPLFPVFDVSVFSLLINLVSLVIPRYLGYNDPVYLANQNSTGLFFPFIVFFCFFLAGIYWYLREPLANDKFLRTMLLICMMAISFMWIFYDHVAVAARIGELLLIPIVILLCSLDLELKKNHLFLQRAAVFGTSLAYGAARIYYLYLR